MSHHGEYQKQGLSPEMQAMLGRHNEPEQKPTVTPLGKTGLYPEGKVCPEDEGEIQIAIGSDPERSVVILDFGAKPINWLGLNPQQAVDIATSLIKQARAVAKEPIRIVLH